MYATLRVAVLVLAARARGVPGGQSVGDQRDAEGLGVYDRPAAGGTGRRRGGSVLLPRLALPVLAVTHCDDSCLLAHARMRTAC